MRLMSEEERDLIAATKVIDVKYWYPIPSLHRDYALSIIQPYLMSQGIYSRGRFGGWQYEVGNMDHSTVMGVEFVNHILLGEAEQTWKLRVVNHVPEQVHAPVVMAGSAYHCRRTIVQ